MILQCLFSSIFILLSLKHGVTEKLPESFKKCSQKDNACLKDAIEDALPKLRDGIPELDVPALDPLYIGVMIIGSGPQIVSFEQKYHNTRLSGLSSSKVHDFIFDLDKGKIAMNFTAPIAHLNATYDINGKILAIPIHGHDQASLTLVGYHGDIEMMIEVYTKNKNKHLRITQYAFELVLDKIEFKVDNLFDGNALLSDNMNKVLNENWEPIYKDVIADYAKVYGNKLTELANKLFAKVPISELFLD